MYSTYQSKIQTEINVCLEAKMKADALGQTILSGLHFTRIIQLLTRKSEPEFHLLKDERKTERELGAS